MLRRKCYSLVTGFFAVLSIVCARGEQVVLSEVMYHPQAGLPEYVEIYNNTATPFDIALWRLSGGAAYTFPDFSAADPERTFLRPFERIVLAGAEEATVRSAYNVPTTVRVFGAWDGALSNGGERISLKDKNGVTVCTLDYKDRSPWPVAADGTGHSLVLKNPNRSLDDWRNWILSQRPGGTPGYEAVIEAETEIANPEVTQENGLVVVDFDHVWRFHDDNLDLGTSWRGTSYADSSWAQGPGLFGFENSVLPAPGIQTGLQDFNQLTYYFRTEFNYSGPTTGAQITLDHILDDGAVFYLNGVEIGRTRVAAGVVTFDSTAQSPAVGNAAIETDVFPVSSQQLVEGRNVFAVEVHQVSTGSSDVVFGARLTITAPLQPQSGLVINEVLPGPAGTGYLELYNTTTSPVDLGGFSLADDLGDLRKYVFPVGTQIGGRSYASFGLEEAGLDWANPVEFYLVATDGVTIENGIKLTMPPDGRSAGRKPSGSSSWYLFSDPTRAGPNSSQQGQSLSIRLNELRFSASNTVAWVELYNGSLEEVSLDDLHLSSRADGLGSLELSGILPAGGFASFDTAFPVDGDEVALFLTHRSGNVFDAQVFEHVIGWDGIQAYPDGNPEFYATAGETRDTPNSPERVTEVVINEVMFDPPSNQRDGEFIELYNRSEETVDLSGWRFSQGIQFRFPVGTELAAGQYLVIGGNADYLRSVYGSVPVIGNFEQQLNNQAELIRLEDAWGNLVDEVDYRVGGDWPLLTQGDGSSLELVNPWMDNGLSSAWRDSQEAGKSTTWQSFTIQGTYQNLNPMGVTTDYRELHFHLAGDGYVILQDINLQKNGSGANLIANVQQQSMDGSSASGWLCQGTHWASYVAGRQLHLISDGHGDNRANRVEIDVTSIAPGDSLTLTFSAKWVYGTPRLIAQTWDHSFGEAVRVHIPENLGSPGLPNSVRSVDPHPEVEALKHDPAVPRSSQVVTVTAHVSSADPLSVVRLYHRLDNSNGDGTWSAKVMFDDGVTGGDEVAGDGLFTAQLTEYQVNSQVVQFYVQAQTTMGATTLQPRLGAARPAMYIVDDRSIPTDLRTVRIVISAYDQGAISGGESAKYNYRFPRLSNHYYNMTFIHNDEEIYYGGEIRNSGSPWTRGTSLDRGKWKLPNDRRFRGHEKFTFDNDPTAGRMHHNRMTRYMLYLLGHPVNENEFVRFIVNSGSPTLKEETEPVANDLLDRVFEQGSDGELYRIDDEWWFQDDWNRSNRNADWSYKGTSSPVRYQTEWMKRTREDDYDYSSLTSLFQMASGSFGQQQMEMLVDPEYTLMMAAVRGYIGDWDSFTLNRGKNGYMYRLWDTGRFLFMHWDSDLAFQANHLNDALMNTGRPGIGQYLNQDYNQRLFYYYLSELLDKYTENSPRMQAWLNEEEEANNSFAVASSHYYNWFRDRLSRCLSEMGQDYTRPFAVSTGGGGPITTSGSNLNLTGTAPFRVFRVEVEGHPEAVFHRSGRSNWTTYGIRLREGQQTIIVRAVDQWGGLVDQKVLQVTKTGNASPVAQWNAQPNSWNISVNEAIQLDARDSYDPEGTALVFDWNIPSAVSFLDTNRVGEVKAAFAQPGLYELGLTVTDGAGLQSTLSREVAVYGAEGFSSFKEPWLESFWQADGVTEIRGNSADGNWLSLLDRPGFLTMQLSGDMARPLATPNPSYPFVWRALPTESDWVAQTRLSLPNVKFGTYQTGLLVEVEQQGAITRYVAGVRDGIRIGTSAVSPTGALTHMGSVSTPVEEVAVRARRVGNSLILERLIGDTWQLLHSQSLSAGTKTLRAGMFVASAADAQAVQVAFDYFLVIDPNDTSDLRRNLRVTELMYNPIGGDNYEYVELTNVGMTPLALAGVSFVEGIDFTFGPESLQANERIVVVKDGVAFGERYGDVSIRVAAGIFLGRLDNGGEQLTIVDPEGNVIQSFRFGDSGGWPSRADGKGSSLEVVDAAADYNDPANWNSSLDYSGSPGTVGTVPSLGVVINEVLSHTDPPLEDAIELHNLSDQAVDVSGWYLSDDVALLAKYRLPAGTVIPAGGYGVVYEYQFNNTNNVVNVAFSLDSAYGDDVWLVAADAQGNVSRFVDHVDFEAARNGVSFGRYPNGMGELTAMRETTFGITHPVSLEQFRSGAGQFNAYASVGPIVLQRVLFAPQGTDEEYLEFYNLSAQAVTLFDPGHTTNTWQLRDGVEFLFPTNVTITAGESFLVVGSDPAGFRSRQGVGAGTQVFGPYTGQLSNQGDDVRLYQPDTPQTQGAELGYVPYLRVERVRYNDHAPWPVLAATHGALLERRDPAAYGNDPENWYTDYDQDTVADDWEAAYGYSPFDLADASLDEDADGWTTAEEYILGSNPLDAGEGLRLFDVTADGDGLRFRFVAPGQRSFVLSYCDDLSVRQWTETESYAAQPSPRLIDVLVSLPRTEANRFYQVRASDL